MDRLNHFRQIMLREEIEIRDRKNDKIPAGKEPEDLKIGDVFLRRKQPTEIENKLDSKWKGPFSIIDCCGKGGYKIKDPFGYSFTVNRKNLKKWKTPIQYTG